MCGIAGWVDFERDFSGDRSAYGITHAMSETMACRGPDAAGLWVGSHVGLGHRRLAVIDIEGGTQPMSFASPDDVPRDVACLTFSGEVYNFQELRTELEGAGHRFRTRSDTEVVLHAYLEWGESFPERLNGMFALAIWDARTEELLLVRDRMGVKPLYYVQTPNGVLFGSEPKAILAHPDYEAEVDLDGLRQILSRIKIPGQAPWRNMREVRPGTSVAVTHGGLRERTYWKLEALPHTDDLATTVTRVRDLLEDIVGRQLVADVPLCLLLSGGLDSSAITALAAAQHRALGLPPVRTFAVDFVGQAESYEASTGRGMGRTYDTPFVHQVAEHVGSMHADVVLSSAELASPAVRAAVLRARDLPIGGGDFDTSLYLLFRTIREHSTVALSGESADEVFGGYAWFHSPRILQSTTFPWVGGSLFLPMLEPELARQLDLRAFRAQSYADAVAEVPHVLGRIPDDARTPDHPDWVEYKMREVCYLALTRFVQTLLDRKDRLSMAVGLEVRVPFCDHRLVQYVFNTPWSMKTFDGREKSLLRAATRSVLPEAVASRRKSPYPVTRDPGYADLLRTEMGAVEADESAPVRQLVRADAIKRLHDPASVPPLPDARPMTTPEVPVEGQSLPRTARGRAVRQGSRQSAERVLSLDAWMRAYHPRIVTGADAPAPAPAESPAESTRA